MTTADLRLIAETLLDTGGNPAAMARSLGYRWDTATCGKLLREVGGVAQCAICLRWLRRRRITDFGLCAECEKAGPIRD